MNENCVEVCKHKDYCKLDSEKTLKCQNYDHEVNRTFGESADKIFGYTTGEIASKQGRPGTDLK